MPTGVYLRTKSSWNKGKPAHNKKSDIIALSSGYLSSYPYFCDCGCMEICSFGCRFILGHHNRCRSEETRRKHGLVTKGRRAWNKNLTKETDVRVAKNAENVRKWSIENSDLLSDKAKYQWSILSKEERKAVIEKGNSARLEYLNSSEGKENCRKGGLASQELRLNKGFAKVKYFYSEKSGKDLYYESSYELRAFEILEQMSVVKSYDRCRFWINYEFEGKFYKYNPDILITYLDGKQEIIEVKSDYTLQGKRNPAKFVVLDVYCKDKGINWSVWKDEQLFS